MEHFTTIAVLANRGGVALPPIVPPAIGCPSAVWKSPSKCSTHPWCFCARCPQASRGLQLAPPGEFAGGGLLFGRSAGALTGRAGGSRAHGSEWKQNETSCRSAQSVQLQHPGPSTTLTPKLSRPARNTPHNLAFVPLSRHFVLRAAQVLPAPTLCAFFLLLPSQASAYPLASHPPPRPACAQHSAPDLLLTC